MYTVHKPTKLKKTVKKTSQFYFRKEREKNSFFPDSLSFGV